MKLNEITPDLIDEMLLKHPIKGVLSFTQMKRLDELCFHTYDGWFHFSRFDLKEIKRYYREEKQDYPIKIEQTNKGIVYCRYDTNRLFLFKKKRNTGILEPIIISLDFSNGMIRNGQNSFLISRGFEYFVKKYINPIINGEIKVGHWQEEYFTEKIEN